MERNGEPDQVQAERYPWESGLHNAIPNAAADSHWSFTAFSESLEVAENGPRSFEQVTVPPVIGREERSSVAAAHFEDGWLCASEALQLPPVLVTPFRTRPGEFRDIPVGPVNEAHCPFHYDFLRDLVDIGDFLVSRCCRISLDVRSRCGMWLSAESGERGSPDRLALTCDDHVLESGLQ